MTKSTGKVLYYLGKPGDGFGGGVANKNLIRALESRCELRPVTTDRTRFDAPVFVPLGDVGLKPEQTIKAPRLLGYGFWEMPIAVERAKINASRYHWIFAGSEWCANRVRQATGATHVSALLQGIDHDIFKPQPWTERNGFRVFSGGKYEFRKGQDIVIAAMKIFMSQRQDVVLVTSWHNPWPHTMLSMKDSWLIEPEKPLDGLPSEKVIQLPPMANADMPKVYAEADCGLFPNRCEAGTNLVMCEFMGCGRPVIATSATGQAEVLQGYPLNLREGSYDCAGWFNAQVNDCLVKLEYLYQHRYQLKPLGDLAAAQVANLNWDKCADQIVAKAFD